MEFGDFFKFDKQLAPTLIKIFYWIGLGIIALITLAGIVGSSLIGGMGSSMSGGMGGYGSSYSSAASGFSIGGALISIVCGAITALFLRVVCEIWLAILSANERLGTLVELKQKEAEKA